MAVPVILQIGMRTSTRALTATVGLALLVGVASASSGSSVAAEVQLGQRVGTQAAGKLESNVASEGLLAYTKRRGKFSQVYVLDLQRGSVRQITRDRSDHYDPQWATDGRRLAFSSLGEDRGGFYPSRIVIVNTKSGGRSVPLFDPRSSSGDLAHALLRPAWSPDGNRLSFTDQTWSIAVVPSDRRSTRWKRLSQGTDSSWSPGGRWIAFTRLFVGPSPEEEGVYLTSRGIWMMRSDGSGLRRVTSKSDWEPDWSPDGQRIVFSRRARTGDAVRWDVVVATAAGRGARRLTSGYAPTWSPDGRQIAFSRNGGIYVITPEGTGERRLLAGPLGDPDWGPGG
jgi:TolB protein